MHVNITLTRLKWLVEATVNRIFGGNMTTIGQALNTVLANQKAHSAKLEAIHAAVLAVGSGGGSEDQLQLLRDILAAVTIPGEPEASPELSAIVERAVAIATTTRALADKLKALTEGD